MSSAEPLVRSDEAYCPHCYLLVESGVEGPWPPTPTRCPHCRLMIGPGRAHASSDGVPGARGAAAGVMAERARQLEGEAEHSAAEVCEGIRRAALASDVAPERLLMVDYQQLAIKDTTLPPLHDVLEHFGSWKRARREAAGQSTGELAVRGG